MWARASLFRRLTRIQTYTKPVASNVDKSSQNIYTDIFHSVLLIFYVEL